MKMLKTGILSIALFAGVSGAFATSLAHQPKPEEVVYTWDLYAPGDENPTEFGIKKTLQQAKDDFGCNSDGTLCAIGNAPGQIKQILRRN